MARVFGKYFLFRGVYFVLGRRELWPGHRTNEDDVWRNVWYYYSEMNTGPLARPPPNDAIAARPSDPFLLPAGYSILPCCTDFEPVDLGA